MHGPMYIKFSGVLNFNTPGGGTPGTSRSSDVGHDRQSPVGQYEVVVVVVVVDCNLFCVDLYLPQR